MGESAVSVLRQALADELAKKVNKYGIVVWDDSNREYATIAAEVVPSDAEFAAWEGSFWALRRRIDPMLAAADPPRLIVYLPCKAPERDPLEELRKAGTKFVCRLETLIKQAVGGQLTDGRIRQIAQQARTIEQAEAALEGSEHGADARLVAVLGASSPSEMVRRLLTPRFDELLEAEDLWDAVVSFLTDAVGVDVPQARGEQLRRSLFAQLVLNVLRAAGAVLPDGLPVPERTPTDRQLCVAREAVARMRTDADAEHYRELARTVDEQLSLASCLEWDPALADCDIIAAVDRVAQDAAVHQLLQGDPRPAGALAGKRLESSWWARAGISGETGIESRWRVIAALANLQEKVRTTPVGDSFSDLLCWYATDGWEVDHAHRQVESLRAVAAIDSDALDEAFQAARASYETWLEHVLNAASTHDAAIDTADALESQRRVHKRVVAAEGPSVFIWVDALRFELGKALSERLTQLPATVEIQPAVATPPTLTPVGMAALLPDADDDLHLTMVGNDLRVRFGSDEVKTVADRVRRLEKAHGRVANLRLTDAVQRSNDWLRQQIESTDLLLIRSQEIDQRGESDLLACTWGDFENILSVLATLVARLLYVGVRSVVIAADHGFLALPREIGPDRVIDPPLGGTGELHRRVWIGRGGTSTSATVKVPLGSFGVRSDLDLILPKGLGVFRAGGGLQFLHGGISPQEMIVPVITITASDTASKPELSIRAQLVGERVTTGVVTIRIEVEGQSRQFEDTGTVRVQLTAGREPCSRILGGDRVDPAGGTVSVAPGQTGIVTLQITRNLPAGSDLNLDVIDATTGTRLDRQPVEVAVDVTVEDDLG